MSCGWKLDVVAYSVWFGNGTGIQQLLHDLRFSSSSSCMQHTPSKLKQRDYDRGGLLGRDHIE